MHGRFHGCTLATLLLLIRSRVDLVPFREFGETYISYVLVELQLALVLDWVLSLRYIFY